MWKRIVIDEPLSFLRERWWRKGWENLVQYGNLDVRLGLLLFPEKALPIALSNKYQPCA